jgi:hypothetical protein
MVKCQGTPAPERPNYAGFSRGVPPYNRGAFVASEIGIFSTSRRWVLKNSLAALALMPLTPALASRPAKSALPNGDARMIHHLLGD